ncbi:KH domain-containing protein [Jeotgalibaca sp. MA1X17-3]|uniref:RNA-binding cell elongation regulator Jag/EloR n=1 Tax=Jeotgalibaca sp. MA1X17-3 TaxID=2908211 RepID=UPI001F333FD1|nr:RNA-binding cell elongation regulator Jag/EloR [Jeotgalibaca sp. MA1X17-3]UJF15804.1 KH domain-containing protein [Jeotgalibaca sp. MA1X17-3]
MELTPKHVPKLEEAGNISLFENKERADYISDNQDEENLGSDQNNYEYSETIEYADLDEPKHSNLDQTKPIIEDDETSLSSRQDAIRHVITYLEDVVEVYGASAKVSVDEKHNLITFNIDTNKAGLVIGKHGKIINSLQTLAQTIFQYHQQRRVAVVVNVGDYRQRRESILQNIADRTAERVLRTKQPIFLEPLPAFERKQIHARLSKDTRISTHSEGKEPHRYLVVEVAK